MVTLKVELILSLDLQFHERTGEEGIEKKSTILKSILLGRLPYFYIYFHPNFPCFIVSCCSLFYMHCCSTLSWGMGEMVNKDRKYYN